LGSFTTTFDISGEHRQSDAARHAIRVIDEVAGETPLAASELDLH